MKIILLGSYFLFGALALSIAQSGLYMRTQFVGSQLDISWLYFTSDKKIIRNPKYGVNPVMLDKEKAENPQNIASILQSGAGKMSIQWGKEKLYTINVEFKNGILAAFDGGICTKPSIFAFKKFQNKTYSGLAVIGNISKSIILFLGEDGRFTMERLGAVSGSGNFSGAATSTSKEEGSYSINGNTIVFRYSDGKEWRVVAQPYDLGNEEIIIGDQLFKKMK